MAKKIVIGAFALCVVTSSCFSRSSAMTYNEFDQLQTGTTLTSLQEQAGHPYQIHTRKDGSTEYEYIERVNSGGVVVMQNHYFIVVKDGKVIGKYMKTEQPPAYNLIYQEEPNYPGGSP